MYRNRLLFLLTLLLALAVTAPAQTPSGLPANATLLKSRADQWRREGGREQDRARAWARKKGWLVRQVLPDGALLSLQRLDENGHPVYYITDFNTRAAATTRTDQLWSGGALGLNLSGNSTNVTGKLAMWDGGPVRGTHRELAGRVVQADAGAVVDPGTGAGHATHVAGTLMSGGIHPLSRGMAFGFTGLQAYDFSNDLAEMAAAASKLLISNHSYGMLAGWRINPSRAGTPIDPSWEWLGDVNVSAVEDARFGFYNADAQRWDEITFNAPYYLPVKSAGNFRSQNGPQVGQPFWRRNSGGSFELVAARPEGISSNNSYDNITTYGTAKNCLTVGAVEPIARGHNQPSDVRIAGFSSWGPTDDGRIKPDLVANGVAVFSAGGASDSAYATLNGTSMATPNVAGTLMLLQEYFASLHNGAFMRAATLKGLVIHSADEAGTAPGPDYAYGWGLLNARKAAQIIANDQNDHLLTEKLLAQGETYALPVVASGKGPLVVTISWTDPPGTALTPSATNVNNRSPRLVNDLDLRVTDERGMYLPWALSPDAPATPAKTGDNSRDNVEQVVIADPVPGRAYTVRVSHKGTLQNGRQAYTLVASGSGGQAFCVTAGLSNTGLRIGKVTIGAINNTSGGNCISYADFTHLSANVAAGQSLPLVVTLSSCNRPVGGIVNIFVDWNGDSNFFGPGEWAAASGTIPGAGTFNARIAVPASVFPGQAVRMRIVCARTATATAAYACGNYPEGETEDYTLRVVRPSLDVLPAGLIYPEAAICPGPGQPVAVTIRNSGTRPVENVPVQVEIRGESGPEQALKGTLAGVLMPFAEGTVAMNGTFTARPGEKYTFAVRVLASADLNKGNDTITFRRTVALPELSPIASATICTSDSVQLQAKGGGVAYWYDAPQGGNLVGVGTQTKTVRTGSNTYYAALNAFTGKVGPTSKRFATDGGYNQFTPAIRITTQVPLVIESARLYVGNEGRVTFTVQTPSGVPVASCIVDVQATRIPSGARALPDMPTDTGKVYPLRLPIPRPGDYQISVSYENGATLFRNNSGVTGYPFSIPGIISIGGNTATDNPETSYYYLYDVQVKALGCASPRVAVLTNLIDAPAPTAVLEGGGTICQGDSAQLMVHLSGTPPWSLTYVNGADTTRIQGITSTPLRVSVAKAGVYIITTLTDSRSCPVYGVTGKATVTVQPRAVAMISITDHTLTASEGLSYQWYLDGTLLLGANTRYLEITRNGYYQVEISYANGCKSLSGQVPVSIPGLPVAGGTQINQLPNPTDGIFVLQAFPFLPPILRVRLVNLLGQTLRLWEAPNLVRRSEVQFDISSIQNGSYLLLVEEHERVHVYKLQKY